LKREGGNGNEIIQDIVPTNDGNFVILGITDLEDQDVQCAPKGLHDAWVIKIDSGGNIIWQQCFGGSKEEANPYSRIIQTADGGYMLMMESWSQDYDAVGSHGFDDVLVVRMNSDGEKIWSRAYGGSEDENPRCILELSDHHFLLLMRSTSSDGDVPPNIDNNNRDAWVIIIDDNGTILTNNIYGGTNDDDLYSAIQRANGTIMLAGNTLSNDGDLEGKNVQSSDGWLLITSKDGTILQNEVFGNTGYDLLRQILPADNGKYLLVGESDDSSMQVQRGSYHGDTDFWVVKLKKNGATEWQGLYGGSRGEHVARVARAGDGTYYLAGGSHSDDGDIISYFNGNSSRNCCILQLSKGGAVLQGYSIGGSELEGFNSIAWSLNGLIAAGYSYSHDGQVTDCNGTADGWVVSLQNNSPMEKTTNDPTVELKVWPNPSNGEVEFAIDDFAQQKNVHIRILNILGIELLNQSFEDVAIKTTLLPGIYFAQILNGENEILDEQELFVAR